MDEHRMQWAIDDIIKNRPALSRWHADWKAEFEAFMTEKEQRRERDLDGMSSCKPTTTPR
jgi:hypothetical protein